MRRVAVLLGVLLLLAGCSGPGRADGTGADQGRTASAPRVDVDTPALRAQKDRAGVATCRPGRGASRLPEVTLACLGGGRAVDLARLRGPLVINLFAQWCGPCRTELPYYQELHRKAAGTVGVLGVDYQDAQPSRALALIEKTGVTYPLLADPRGELEDPLRVRAMPTLVLVHRDGTVQAIARSVRSYAELRTLVQDELHVELPA